MTTLYKKCLSAFEVSVALLETLWFGPFIYKVEKLRLGRRGHLPRVTHLVAGLGPRPQLCPLCQDNPPSLSLSRWKELIVVLPNPE